MKRKSARNAGLAFVILFFLCAIVCIILAGIMYDFANPDFKAFPWGPLSALEIASIAYVFFVAFIGFAAFAHPKTGILAAFIVFLILSILFTMAIAIFAIVAGSTGYLNILFGCGANITGIMEIWRGMDAYLVNADQNFCSPACPCFISNTNAFINNVNNNAFINNVNGNTLINNANTNAAINNANGNAAINNANANAAINNANVNAAINNANGNTFIGNPNTNQFFNQWTRTNNPADAVNFQGCSNVVKLATYNNARLTSPDFDPLNNFNQINFWNYMARIENRFQCTGFCQSNYGNTVTNSQMFMVKYLFTDINRGPPIFTGCLDQIINFLPPFLLAFGAVGLLLSGFQIFALAFAIILVKHKKHHHDKEVVVVDKKPVVVEQPVIAYDRKDVYIERP